MKDDLQTWFKQLTDGQLSKEDCAFLVKERKDVAEMAVLTSRKTATSLWCPA